MAFLLNIETSTKNCSVSFSENGKLLSLCEQTNPNYSHAESLHKFVNWALEATEKNISDLDGVCVSAGPGSYTGLRIGLAAAKGICFALEIPLISMLSLDALVGGVKMEDFQKIIPMIDARRMEVYTAVYNTNRQALTEPISLVIAPHSFAEFRNERLLFLGDGAIKCKEILYNPNWFFLEALPSAKNMIELSYEKYLKNEFEDLQSFAPSYLKEFVPVEQKNPLIQ